MNTNMLKPAKLMIVDENGNQTELNGTIELEDFIKCLKDNSYEVEELKHE